MRDTKGLGEIGGSSLAMDGDQIGNRLDIILSPFLSVLGTRLTLEVCQLHIHGGNGSASEYSRLGTGFRG